MKDEKKRLEKIVRNKKRRAQIRKSSLKLKTQKAKQHYEDMRKGKLVRKRIKEQT
jgi:hypothetical protein